MYALWWICIKTRLQKDSINSNDSNKKMIVVFQGQSQWVNQSTGMTFRALCHVSTRWVENWRCWCCWVVAGEERCCLLPASPFWSLPKRRSFLIATVTLKETPYWLTGIPHCHIVGQTSWASKLCQQYAMPLPQDQRPRCHPHGP